MLSPVKIWRNQKKIASLIGKQGVIVSWTRIRVPPADFTNLAPYPVAMVRFADQSMMIVQLVDWDETQLRVGQNVVTVIRRLSRTSDDGVIPYGIKAVPVEER